MTDRSVIYDAANDRYMGVHPWRKKGRTPRWRAAVTVGDTLVELSSHRRREDAADAVVAYFKARYGPNWERVINARTGGRAWHLTRVRPAGGVYMADVWVNGSPVVVTVALVRDKRGAAGRGWATRDDARRAVAELKTRLCRAGDSMQRPTVVRWAV